MRRMPSKIILLLIAANIFAQSPHGKNFKIECSVCHNSESWKVKTSQISFDHAKTNFTLAGQHKTVECRSCHESLVFAEAKNGCFDCHKDIHQNSVSHDCSRCHTPQSWLIQNINELHLKSRFPLLGGHLNQDCAQCHINYPVLKFDAQGIECFDCHKKDYASAKNPDHVAGNISTYCVSCHSITSFNWNSANTTHDFFPLRGGHSITNCFACHKAGTYSGLSKDCYSCHRTSYTQTNNPNHMTANFSTNCTDCHTIDGWTPSTFNHSTTGFILTGKHIGQNCSACHTTGYTNTPNTCYGCHQTNYTQTTNPNHMGANFPNTCADCHTTNGWTPATFDHDGKFFHIYSGKHQGRWNTCADCHNVSSNYAVYTCISCHEHNQTDMNQKHSGISGYSYVSTACLSCHPAGSSQGAFNHNTVGFQLLGTHATITCQQCHTNGYANTSPLCVSCHQTPYNNSKNPNHQVVGITNDCMKCHNTSLWVPSLFSHSATAFPLTGKHNSAACESCHKGVTTGTSAVCYSCHKTNYTSSINPNHQTVGISNDCAKCHNTNLWTPSIFSHSATAFPLTGKHNTSPCESCHKGVTAGTSAVCYSCHKTNYDASTNPNHLTSNIPNTCVQCHSTSAWSPASFNHALTKFPLLGSHATAACQQCHAGGYINTSMVCVSCHQSAYSNSKNPNHQTVGISNDCAKCHNTSVWAPSIFSHSVTAFPLTGKHTTATCESCHKGVTTGTSAVCYSCHKTNYDASTNPNHLLSNIPNTCDQCHSTSAWSPASFNHALTKFPLLGSHATAACQQCHAGGYTNTSMVCSSCHQSAYNNSKNPNHRVVGISTDCTKCHNTTIWIPSTFSHAATAFPLTGIHLTTACESCHKGVTTGTSTLCYSCHQTNYVQATNPNHVASSFPTTCGQCHTTRGWSPATFDHSLTKFPLTGKHTTVACTSCHKNGYTPIPADCYSCHQANYTGTTNPNHAAASFPITCADCHTTSGWTPATFDHDGKYFPIYSGSHKGNWNTCADCHTIASNYAVFECINCHTHTKTTTDSHHKGVANYTYLSSACYSCHPKGRS